MVSAEQVTAGHGRIERRRLWALPVFDDFLQWPSASTMLRLERTRTHKATGQSSTEIVYALTSLSLDQITAHDLLTRCREHWHIENKLHYVRDQTLGEDASRVRSAHAPQVMAALRNTIITAARHAGYHNVAQALRDFAASPYRALGQFILL